MKYARLRVGAQVVLASIEDNRANPLTLDNGDGLVDPLRAWLMGAGAAPMASVMALDQGDLLAPISSPRMILAVGLNYKAHASEQHIDTPSSPLLFNKAPGSIIGTGDVIRAKSRLSTMVDYEGELAVVMGREAKNISVEEALDYVLGYTICNDVTARDAQRGDGQFFRGKSFDTFCPLGPWIVGTDEISDPQALTIRTTINGEVRQHSSTSEMIYSVAEIISYASQYFALLPGDVITTGSPSGVGAGMDPPVYLQDGDEVVIEIDGIGALRNTVSTAE